MAKPASFPKKKSGDSKLQDGHAAREADRHEVAPVIDSLPEMLQDKAEQVRAKGDSDRADAIERALGKLTEALELVSKKNASLEQQLSDLKANKITAPDLKARVRCAKCHQILRDAAGNGACDGDHVYIFVAPADRALWNAYPGVKWNGAKYNGYAWVPRSIANSVMSAVHRWEQRERMLYLKGGHIFGAGAGFETGNTAIAPIIAAS